MDSLLSFPVGLFHPLVGSRTGAVLRRFSLSVFSPFPLGVPHYPNRKPVSSPRLIKPSGRISRTGLSCLLRVTSMLLFQPGKAFAGGATRNTRYSLNNPSVP
jgi:hypothetical protein